jgi:hypothetical protein
LKVEMPLEKVEPFEELPNTLIHVITNNPLAY